MGHQLSKSDPQAIRTFLAIDLPDSLKFEIGRLESEFVDHGSALKWSNPELLHITVRFLGGVAPDCMAAVKRAAQEATAQVSAFSLALTGLGAFPNDRTPRVIWIGLRHDSGYVDLQRLYGLAEDALASGGFPSEGRPFSPHITLARTRDGISPGDRQGLGMTLQCVRAARDVSGEFPVERLTVMRSDLSRAGPRYTPLAQYPLRARE